MKIQINGEDWKIHLYDDEAFSHGRGIGNQAFADTIDKYIVFNEDDLDLEVVIHELVHAYSCYLCINTTNLTVDQTEEIYCEFFAKNGDKLIKQARKLYRDLRR